MKALALIFILFISFSALAKASLCLHAQPEKIFIPTYARNFKINYYKNYKAILVDGEAYILSAGFVKCDDKVQAFIKTPVTHVAFMSTTYLPALEILHKEKSLIAFQGKEYIVSKAFQKSALKDLSFKLNPEDLLNLNADLIMGHSSNLSDSKQKTVLKRLSLPVVINKDFEETSPLARAEWLIFISAFYNEEEKAVSVFNEIEKNYLALKKRNEVSTKAKVVVGSIENGFWVTCGGKSDLAQMIRDAGGDLAYSSSDHETQSLSLEHIVKNKQEFDVWLTHNSWTSEKNRMDALEKDPRYQFIKAKRIYNNNLIRKENGATDFWETAVQRPDWLLKDLSLLFHPEQYKGETLKWYRKI